MASIMIRLAGGLDPLSYGRGRLAGTGVGSQGRKKTRKRRNVETSNYLAAELAPRSLLENEKRRKYPHPSPLPWGEGIREREEEVSDTFSYSDWDLVEARAINDNGWITGWGFHDGHHRAFLLTPLDDFCPADFNGDGEVSTADLLILFANWGDCPDASDGKLCIEDLDANCTVSTNDLLLLFADWGLCGQQGGTIPQNVLDCLTRYCCAPENLLALEKYLCAVDPECDPSP